VVYHLYHVPDSLSVYVVYHLYHVTDSLLLQHEDKVVFFSIVG
jgi:hypothetical protein